MFGGRVADDGDRNLARHPGKEIARGEAEADRDRVGRGRRLGARVRIRGDDGLNPAVLTFEADEQPADRGRLHADGGRPDRDDPAEIHTCRVQLLGGSCGHDPGQPVSRADRVDLGRPGRDDDLVGRDVEHPGRRADDDQRSGVDRDDLVARCASRTRTDLPARSASAAAAGPLDPPPMTATSTSRWCSGDRRRAAASMSDPRRPPRGVAGIAPTRMPRDPQPRPGGRLARPDVGDAIDLGKAVPAVAGEAQRPAAARDLTPAQDRDRDRIPSLERHGPTVDDDPTLGHWRIRRPCGSNSGSGWSRAGHRRPMISISKPEPPGPSGVASSVGT